MAPCFRTVASPRELALAHEIRERVFVREQGIPAELDRDGLDGPARHLLVYSGGRAVATGRVLIRDGGEAVLARIAVLPAHRGRGLGRRVVEELEALAEAAGAKTLSLHPHRHLERFYESLGYRTVPGTEQVGRHELITMTKRTRAGGSQPQPTGRSCNEWRGGHGQGT